MFSRRVINYFKFHTDCSRYLNRTLVFDQSAYKIDRPKAKGFKSRRRRFQRSSVLQNKDRTHVLVAVKDASCHAKGPFKTEHIGNNTISYICDLPIVEQVRKVKIRKPPASVYIQEAIDGMPIDYESKIGYVDNLHLTSAS